MSQPNPWGILTLTTIIGTFTQTQKYLLSYIASDSNLFEDTGLDNSKYGVLSGGVMLGTYAIFSMLLGRSTDKIVRPLWFIVIGTVLLGCVTAANGTASSFGELLVYRFGFGVLASFIEPMILKVLVSYFDDSCRGVASGLYFLSIYLGISLSSLSILMTEAVGWRKTFFVIGGVCGGCSGLLALCLRHVKLAPNVITKNSISADLPLLVSNKTVVLTLCGLFFIYIGGFARTFFDVMYFIKAFPRHSETYSILNSVALLVCSAGAVIGGKWSDLLGTSNIKWKPWMISISLLITTPLLVAMYLSDSFLVSMILMFAVSCVSETYISVSYSTLISVTVPNIRGLQTSCMISITFISGVATSVILGFGDSSLSSLRTMLICFVSVGNILGLICFFSVGKYYPNDLLSRKTQEGFTERFTEDTLL